MADPLSVASGITGLVSLAIQATQLTCKYVAEVSHAGETALQCLRSSSLLRDVLESILESQNNEDLTLITKRKSHLATSHEIQKCGQSLDKIHLKLKTLFRDDGKIKRRKALMWPFQSSESDALIKRLQDFRDTFAAFLAADSLEVSVKSYHAIADTREDVRSIRTDMKQIASVHNAKEVLDTIFAEDAENWRFGSDKVQPVGTGSWLFDSAEFKYWLKSDGGILWCQGAPGSGKSVLMGQAISWLQQHATVVLSNFCDHRDPRSQDPDMIMRHLIRQGIMQLDSVLQHVLSSTVYEEAKRNRRNLRKAEVQRIFLKIFDVSSQISIVIDGLDECPQELKGSEPRGEISQILNMAASKGAKGLVASRTLADISAGLEQCSTVTIKAKEVDLRAYVDVRLDWIEKRLPQAVKMKTAVVDKVIMEADGVFLMARLMMDLLAPTTVKNVRQIKQFLSKDCWNLPGMYRTTLDRIISSDEASAELAKKILMWLGYAQRPLHESELQHAIATEFDDDDFGPDGITPGELLQDSCMGIVACDERGMYSLFHLTAYEFFRSSPEFRAAAAHSLIAKTCIAYLSFASIGSQGACSDLESLELRKQDFSLLDYAAKHWGDHARQAEEELLEVIVTFITHDEMRRALKPSTIVTGKMKSSAAFPLKLCLQALPHYKLFVDAA